MSDSQPRPEACDRCGRSKDDCRCRPGGGPKSLSQVQREITAWARSQFGDNVSRDDTSAAFGHPLGSLAPLLGMFEELGELAHAVVYRHQGRGYADPAEHRGAKEDALADLMVFACDFAGREGIDLEAVLGEVWERVSKRRRDNWLADKRSEGAAAGGRAAALRRHMGRPAGETESYSPDRRSARSGRARARPAAGPRTEAGRQGPPVTRLERVPLPQVRRVPPLVQRLHGVSPAGAEGPDRRRSHEGPRGRRRRGVL
jgi:NTP pyrophosphatase (non-canonical NTP hydrolase)